VSQSIDFALPASPLTASFDGPQLTSEGKYQAGSWDHERRVVFKAEALEKGLNTRFVVTTRDDAPEEFYTWYTQRGNHPERCIKDLKEDCFADRLSCHSF
jgi:hypothetical protein